MFFPLLLLFGGGATLLFLALKDNDRPVPAHEPDEPLSRGTTGYKKVDAILDQLRKAAAASGVPLGLLVGWIARESGGRIDEVTKLDERGLFQLMPSESKALGLNHERLSTDLVYSINGGLALIGKYMGAVDALNVTPRGTSYYWKLVKLMHTMGSGATNKIVQAAKSDGQAGSWDTLEAYAINRNAQFLSSTKHSPAKWFPLVDKVYATGAPFGFGGGGGDQIVGAAGRPLFTDIPDPIDCIRS